MTLQIIHDERIEFLSGRRDILSYRFNPALGQLVVVCLGDGSLEKLRLAHIEGLDDKANALLGQAGYATAREVQRASDEELKAIDGIGPKLLKDIREAVS